MKKCSAKQTDTVFVFSTKFRTRFHVPNIYKNSAEQLTHVRGRNRFRMMSISTQRTRCLATWNTTCSKLSSRNKKLKKQTKRTRNNYSRNVMIPQWNWVWLWNEIFGLSDDENLLFCWQNLDEFVSKVMMQLLRHRLDSVRTCQQLNPRKLARTTQKNNQRQNAGGVSPI